MTETNTLARSLHDLGLAAWFGGSMMGAVGLNGATSEIDNRTDRVRVANSGWGRWTPVNAIAIGAHLLGGLQLTKENKARLAGQQDVGRLSLYKTGFTFAALGATAYSRLLGQKIMNAEAEQSQVAAEGATTPAQGTPPEVAKAQKQLQFLQFLIPVLTGGVLVLNAKMGEQQRPAEVAKGFVSRLNPVG
jgi:hypothetical protein